MDADRDREKEKGIEAPEVFENRSLYLRLSAFICGSC